jgi:hypothetical protein
MWAACRAQSKIPRNKEWAARWRKKEGGRERWVGSGWKQRWAGGRGFVKWRGRRMVFNKPYERGKQNNLGL